MTAMSGRAREEGYSLLETLAAMFLVALASGVVVTSLPERSDPREDDALAFAAKLHNAAEEAVISGFVVGVDVDDAGYRFRRRVAGEWTGFGDARLYGDRVWPDDAIVNVSVAGDRADARRLADVSRDSLTTPTLRFDPTGAATPAEVWISYYDATYRVRLDADGTVDFETDDAG